jgi:glycosyltransferase involved in cell wall biosynthesis
MKIIYITGRETHYPRNEVLLRAFNRFSEVRVIGYPSRGSLLFRSILLTLRAIPFLVFGKYDLVFVGFYGHFIMLIVGMLSHAPVLFDAFVSTYDTIILDRKQFSPNSTAAKWAIWLDRTACRLADWVLVDTPLQVDYFQDHIVSSNKPISTIPVGCNEELFYPREPQKNPRFSVLYYCSFLPLHGADIVVQAAVYLREAPIQIKLIGLGPDYNRVRQLAKDLDIDNISWIDSVPLGQIPVEIGAADVCLGGHFGSSEKAGRVVPGKIYQILAGERAVIAGDTPANRMFLTHRRNALLCPTGDPKRLADSILELYHEPIECEKIASEGRKLFEERFCEAAITKDVRLICDQLSRRN